MDASWSKQQNRFRERNDVRKLEETRSSRVYGEGDEPGLSGGQQKASESCGAQAQALDSGSSVGDLPFRRACDLVAAGHVAIKQEDQKDNDAAAVRATNSDGSSEDSPSQRHHNQTLLQGIVAAAVSKASDVGSGLHGAVLDDAAGSFRPPFESCNHSDGQRSGETFGCEDADEWLGQTCLFSREGGDHSIPRKEKDRPDGGCPDVTCHRAHPTGASAGKTASVFCEDSFEPTVLDPQWFQRTMPIPETASVDQGEGWGEEFHCAEKMESSRSSKAGSHERCGVSSWSSPRITLDEKVHEGPRSVRKREEDTDDGLVEDFERIGKGRLCAFLGREILPAPPPRKIPLPSASSYHDVELSLLSAMKEASYAGLVGDLLPQPKMFSVSPSQASRETTAGEECDLEVKVENEDEQTFNEPAVETVNWEEIFPWLTEPQREIVSTILDPHLFHTCVLNSAASTLTPEQLQSCRKPSMSRSLQRQLTRLGYAGKVGTLPKVLCPVFGVPRPDGKIRLIFDGRKLNSICHPPPPFHFRPLSEQLTRLLAPNICHFIVLDFKSWFVQLRPHPKIALFFATKLADGVYIIRGLPMGWAWASIAQFTAEAFTRRVLANLPTGILAFVYIDNIIFGFPSELKWCLAKAKRSIINIANICGTIIKKDSLIVAPKITWLGLELCAVSHTFRLKEDFIQKVTLIWERTTMFSSLPLRAWYALLSCLIHIVWTRQDHLSIIWEIIGFMSDLGLKAVEENNWDHVVSLPPPIWAALSSSFSHFLKNPWEPIPKHLPMSPHLNAVGISDASLACRAYACHSSHVMSLQVISNVPTCNENIFDWELMAMLEGQNTILDSLQPGDSYVWLADNTAAIFVSRRGLSCKRIHNPQLKDLFLSRKAREISVRYAYIPSEINPVDLLSRQATPGSITRSACQAHPGALCHHFLAWIANCPLVKTS